MSKIYYPPRKYTGTWSVTQYYLFHLASCYNPLPWVCHLFHSDFVSSWLHCVPHTLLHPDAFTDLLSPFIASHLCTFFIDKLTVCMVSCELAQRGVGVISLRLSGCGYRVMGEVLGATLYSGWYWSSFAILLIYWRLMMIYWTLPSSTALPIFTVMKCNFFCSQQRTIKELIYLHQRIRMIIGLIVITDVLDWELSFSAYSDHIH